VLKFKSKSDLNKLRQDNPAYPVVSDLVQVLIEDFPEQPYSANDYGYICLVGPEDTGRVLSDLDMPWSLADIPWEGASKRDGFIYAVYLGTDDYGLGFVIPDEPWVNGRLREVLEDILD
jgi:hypothetical protein